MDLRRQIEEMLADGMEEYEWFVRHQTGKHQELHRRVLSVRRPGSRYLEDVLSVSPDEDWELLPTICTFLNEVKELAVVLKNAELVQKELKVERESREAIEDVLEQVVFYKDRLPTDLAERVQAMVRGFDGLGETKTDNVVTLSSQQ
jgi:hypothetical protein